MMGRLNQDQGRLLYSFCLDEVVPDDHLARKIASVLDLSWVHAELTPHYWHEAGDIVEQSSSDIWSACVRAVRAAM
jgi:hypothetical protein